MSRIDEALRLSRSSRAALDINRAAFEIGPGYYPPEGTSSNQRQANAAPLRTPFQPRIEPSDREWAGLTRIGNEKLVSCGADIVSTEQYSRLAAALHDAQIEQGTRTLMVTSALPQEGKTLTVTNLALTLSRLYGRRVLLIDADLRRPSVHELLNLPNRIGLGAVLRSDQVEVPIVDITPQLSVFVAGPPNASPVAALATTRMKDIIDVTGAEFDWVLVDTPPVNLLPDANLIARWVDGVLLVIAARVTDYRAVQDALALIGPERVVGSVLNRADHLDVGTGQYSGYYRQS